jgi:hypothetical protein
MPVVVIGSALAAALLVGVAFVAFDVGGSDDSDATSSDLPASEETLSTSTEERLTADSRLGYAGLGPLRLGMSIAEVEKAGKVTVSIPSCTARIESPEAGLALFDVSGYFGGDGELWVIEVGTPAISTISGIHVGSTADDVRRAYSNVVESGVVEAPVANGYSYFTQTITNPEGRFIRFVVDTDERVRHMSLSLSREAQGGYDTC